MPSPACYMGQIKHVNRLGTSDRVMFSIQMDFPVTVVFILLLIFLRLNEKLDFHLNRNLLSSTFLWFSSKSRLSGQSRHAINYTSCCQRKDEQIRMSGSGEK